MDDPLPMRRRQGVGDLGRHPQRLIERQPPLLQALRQRTAGQMLQDEIVDGIGTRASAFGIRDPGLGTRRIISNENNVPKVTVRTIVSTSGLEYLHGH